MPVAGEVRFGLRRGGVRSRIQTALDAEGRPLDSQVDRRFGRFADELEWYAEALRDRRGKGLPY